MTSTGIPIEWLFGALGAMMLAIYTGIITELKSSRKAGTRRDRLLVLICAKLNIPFNFDGD